MRVLGTFMRAVLNINTIWGLMILISFFLCAAQHYLPTTSVIPVDRLTDGDNTLTVRLAASGGGEDGAPGSFDYTLPMRAGELAIEPTDQERGRERPWLISTERVGEGVLLKWDCSSHGAYDLAVNGEIIAGGNLVTFQSLTDAAFDYAKIGFDIALGLVAAMVLFLGLMKVGEHAGIVQIVARVFYPIIRFLFPDVPKDHPANGAILMNVTTTVLGLGNAATPFGLKAMKELQSLNPHPEIASDSEVMLLGYNTAGFAILPTTLLALRKSAGCSDPFEIIGTCMVAGAVSTITAITMVKLLGRLPLFTIRAAVAEHAREAAPAPGAETGRGAGEGE